ncbi:hypothetical protein LG314_10215 [Agrococcus terreus]|uniref:hypothetical protein n=1 Tax=Agrococcus terreus TaxID=574649 RepID=UPI00384B6212
MQAAATRLEPLRIAGLWLVAAASLALAAFGWARSGDSDYALAWFGWTIVGALLLTARPGNWIGRILLGIGAYWSVGGAAYAVGGLPIVDPLLQWGWQASWPTLAILVLVFPAGRIRTRLGRWLLRALVAYMAVLLLAVLLSVERMPWSGSAALEGVPGLMPLVDVVYGGAFVVAPIAIGAALVELILRWRRAEGVDRLQFRWLVLGTAVTVAVLLVNAALGAEHGSLLGRASAIGLNAIPAAIWIAVTRHGLYEIGRLVSRTVAYAIVTALAVGVFALVVTSTGWLVPELPSVGVAVATLVAAAISLPALRWVQRRIDRAFDRERYDAQRIVDGFGERLRSDPDPTAAAEQLREAADRALQPSHLGVWVRGVAP